MKNEINEMMSTIPVEKGVKSDLQILRLGIVSEMDAISLYEQLSSIATNEKIKKTLLDIAKEEKTHIGEFEYLLTELDKEFNDELDAGYKETEDINEARKRIYGRSSSEEFNKMACIYKKIIK